jgi:hypothetical protein
MAGKCETETPYMNVAEWPKAARPAGLKTNPAIAARLVFAFGPP